MSIVLENISHVTGTQKKVENINLSLAPGSLNVLLGHKDSFTGKTTLMRIMAGLEKPTTGRIMMHGVDITAVAVQKRNVSLVHRQFINYPHLTVWENIASPLRVLGLEKAEIDRKVKEIATLLHIEDYLERYPLELSGGQQQRTSMARALVKDASLILLDEPLVNLDYKLREELRTELRELLKTRNTIAVYATSDPHEAMALGGNVILMHEGQIIQTGPIADVYRMPINVEAAKLLSEPQINFVDGSLSDSEIVFSGAMHFPLNPNIAKLPPAKYCFGIRPSHIRLVPSNDNDLELSMHVVLAEISGSETFMRVSNKHFSLVMHLAGVHAYRTDSPIKVYLSTHRLFVFNESGELIQSPLN